MFASTGKESTIARFEGRMWLLKDARDHHSLHDTAVRSKGLRPVDPAVADLRPFQHWAKFVERAEQLLRKRGFCMGARPDSHERGSKIHIIGAALNIPMNDG